MGTLIEAFWFRLEHLTWRPQQRTRDFAVLVPLKPVDLSKLLRTASRADELGDALDDDRAFGNEMTGRDLMDRLLEEGLLVPDVLYKLDFGHGFESLDLISRDQSRAYVLVPPEDEGGTWDWSVIAAIEPAKSSAAASAFFREFVRSRGKSFHWDARFLGLFPGGKLTTGALLDRDIAVAALREWAAASAKASERAKRKDCACGDGPGNPAANEPPRPRHRKARR